MTINERLEFIRAGYSRAEIEAMETPAPETPAPETPAPETTAPETTAPEPPAPDTPAPETVPIWADALQKSIDKLVNAVQRNNAMYDDMGDTIDTATRAEKALANYITGKK